jgi:hypothetical protein
MYHYKAPHDGCTRFSVKGLKHIDKLGKLISIEAYTVGNKIDLTDFKNWHDNKIRIIVRGEKGSCTYGGFLWGYGGEGPHGLVDLFIKCGMPCILAENYALLGTLGPNDATEKNTKLYNATTLWKFMNSPIGWNRVIIDKPIKTGFIKGQELICTFMVGKSIKCKFIKMYKDSRDMTLVKTDDCKSWCVPLRTLTVI